MAEGSTDAVKAFPRATLSSTRLGAEVPHGNLTEAYHAGMAQNDARTEHFMLGRADREAERNADSKNRFRRIWQGQDKMASLHKELEEASGRKIIFPGGWAEVEEAMQNGETAPHLRVLRADRCYQTYRLGITPPSTAASSRSPSFPTASLRPISSAQPAGLDALTMHVQPESAFPTAGGSGAAAELLGSSMRGGGRSMRKSASDVAPMRTAEFRLRRLFPESRNAKLAQKLGKGHPATDHGRPDPTRIKGGVHGLSK
jgi:hypothetical protein